MPKLEPLSLSLNRVCQRVNDIGSITGMHHLHWSIRSSPVFTEFWQAISLSPASYNNDISHHVFWFFIWCEQFSVKGDTTQVWWFKVGPAPLFYSFLVFSACLCLNRLAPIVVVHLWAASRSGRVSNAKKPHYKIVKNWFTAFKKYFL